MNTSISPEQVLFVGPQGLFRVVIPFKVEVVNPIDNFNIGDHATVYRVIEGNENELLYLVTKRYYSHNNFHYPS